jgi:hypothetical protein
MSQRHHRSLMPITQQEVTAHARAERQRVRVQLARLAAERVEMFDEPGVGYRTPRRRDPDAIVTTPASRAPQHWKQPFWKRRTAMRRARAKAELMLRSE